MNKVDVIFSYLDEMFPNARCELIYHKDYELLFAIILSAQATDRSVNKVTEKLFERYQSLESLASSTPDEIEKIIHSVGLSKTKAKNLHLCANVLIKEFDGKVPSNRSILMRLNGVGRKTANVMRIEYFKIPEIPVDTHVERVSKRLGLTKEKDTVFEVEKKLKRKIPRDRLIKAHHQMIFLGRYICKSQKPNCNDCKLKTICQFYKKLSE